MLYSIKVNRLITILVNININVLVPQTKYFLNNIYLAKKGNTYR